MAAGKTAGRAVDLAGVASAERGLGVIWTQQESADLNANLVRLEAGEGVGIHVNNEADVVFVGVLGSGTVVVDGERFVLKPGQMVFVPRGCLRMTQSSSGEFAYLAVHRREPVRLASLADRTERGNDAVERGLTGGRSAE